MAYENRPATSSGHNEVDTDVSVDLSYKDGAFRCYYDIEALPSLFTVTFWNGRAATLWFFGNSDYDYISDDELRGAFSEYMSDDGHRAILGIDDGHMPDVNLMRFYVGDSESKRALRSNLTKVICCNPMDTDLAYLDGDGKAFVEYVGWNSSNYDLPMLVLIWNVMTSKQSGADPFCPYDIRRLSDFLIEYDGSPFRMAEELAKLIDAHTQMHLIPDQYRYGYNMAMHGDGHIDIAKMLRSTDENTEQRFPPGLKKMEAMMGMDIIADGAVSISDPDYIMGKDELLDFIKYNLHDVAATAAIGDTRDVKNRIYVRDIVRKMFPYTSAKFTEINELHKRQPPERDITEAQLTALSLVGPKKTRPKDYPFVSYDFPIPTKDGSFVNTDLLDYMKKKEEFMPDDIFNFFNHWRGNDTRTWDEFYRLQHSQPITHKATMNVPYYRKSEDGRRIPIDSFIRVSTGGAHGSVMAGLSQYTDSEIAAWTRSDEKPRPEQVVTLDLTDVVHADFASYYPFLMMKMKAFQIDDGSGAEGVDRYADIYHRRIAIKNKLADKPDKSTWTDEEYEISDQQLGLKLQLNSATGKANTRKEYALLPLDNKILSMRLMGNMFIWCLAQRMVNAGGYIVSTNTDGIYVANISLECGQEVIDGFVHDYGVPVDPEIVNRFINRDVSNRMEFYHLDYPNDIRGILRSASKLYFDDTEHGHSVKYPLAAGNAAVRYIAGDMDWLAKPYDRERMRGILDDIRNESEPIAWIQVYASNAKNRLLVDGKKTQKVDRVVLTTDGFTLGQESYRKVSKAAAYAVWVAAHEPDCDGFGYVAEKSGVHLDGDVMKCDVATLVLGKKTKGKGRRDPDMIVPADTLNGVPDNPTYEEFEEIWKNSKANCLLYEFMNGDGVPEYRELKSWSETQLTGYPVGARGVLLDSAHELREFDMSRLDMEAYLEWAESILRTWKVGGVLERDGSITLETFEDDLSVKVGGKRISKAEQERIEALGILHAAYDSILGNND